MFDTVATLDCAGRALWLDRPRVMGIVNVTPDSFADGGQHATIDAAIAHGLRLVEEGADLLDVGGESTRPGAEAVDEATERARVLPVIEALAARTSVPISVDTSKPGVMRAALAAGAGMVNDVRALRAEGALEALAGSKAAVVLMHMAGEPRTMQQAPAYDDVVGDVHRFLAERVFACEIAGVDKRRLVIDPGFGALRRNWRAGAGRPLAQVEPRTDHGSRRGRSRRRIGRRASDRRPERRDAGTRARRGRHGRRAEGVDLGLGAGRAARKDCAAGDPVAG